MKSKEQTLLEQAYQKVLEDNNPDYFEDALANPTNYIVQTFNRETEDYDGNVEYRTVAYIYKKGSMGKNDYKFVDNPDDVENLIDLFKEKNPEGLD